MREAEDRRNADLVIFNTCCVRENAERRALGNVIWLKQLKKEKPDLLIAVCGCMIQQPHMADRILNQYPFIDLAFGTHNLYQLPALRELVGKKRRVISVSAEDDMIAEGLPVKRLNDYKAYITIMYGCDNYCSYCIVPYVRGPGAQPPHGGHPARGRRAAKKRREGDHAAGAEREQLRRRADFPKLFRALDDIGIPRIRFMTSHPKDLSDELIEVMADGKHICSHLHLPVQSGSTKSSRP